MARLPIHGMIHVTGPNDVGKTSFALECGAHPSKIAMLDTDIKGRSAARQLKDIGVELGMYEDMTAATKGMRELQTYAAYMKLFDSIKPGQFEVLIVDVWTSFENTLYPVVRKSPERFKEFYSSMGTIKAGEQWQASFSYEDEIINDLLSKVELLILITHLKSYNIGGKRVEGKFVPACKQPMVSKSLFRIWLERNPNSPVPIALVLKRLNKKVFVDGKIRTINVLPQKVVPRENDESLWDTLEYWYNEPYGMRKVSADEMLTEYELSVLEGTLTEDQKMALKLALIEAEQEEVVMVPRQSLDLEPAEMNGDIVAHIKELHAEGLKFPEIKDRLAKEGISVLIPQIVEAIKGE